MIWLIPWALCGLATALLLIAIADRDLDLNSKDLGDLGFVGFIVLGCLLIWPVFLVIGAVGWACLRAVEKIRKYRTNSLPLEKR